MAFEVIEAMLSCESVIVPYWQLVAAATTTKNSLVSKMLANRQQESEKGRVMERKKSKITCLSNSKQTFPQTVINSHSIPQTV